MSINSLFCIANATIITPVVTLNQGNVFIADGLVEAVGSNDQCPIPDEAPFLDATGMIIAPGFIDLQFNGAFGHDLTYDPAALWQIGAALTRYGVTSFLPTIITAPLPTVRLAQQIWLEGSPEGYSGSTPLGLHVEGPYLNPEKKGAHDPAHLRLPSLNEVISWSPEMGIRLVTLAPELPGALDVISALAQKGVVVSAGHSMATYDETRLGIMAGIRYATHLFNAMMTLHHRQPGLIGALLADERVTIGLIPDGLHVHPALMKMIWPMTHDGRLNLVTDAMSALGMSPGNYKLGSHEVLVSDDRATLDNGTLAGSVLSLDQALRNLLKYTGCSPAEALRTITSTPASLIGLSGRKGQIAPGYDADLVLLSPDFQVMATFVGGQMVYRRAGV